MKVEILRKNVLRNDEHFQFHTEFRDLVTASGAESLKVAAHFAIYEAAIKAAREEVDAAYDTIVERINAFVIVEGEEAYAAFIRTLNTVIAKYTAILNARLGKKGRRHGNETGQEEEPEAELPDENSNPSEEDAA